ncbi:MAG TPA: efflux RND transporter periplasmic adaptor subunit [Arenibaculum sp.]|nr:efflux RND transporter periplasmic adaptor subunit [Arenibaculum sp.]
MLLFALLLTGCGRQHDGPSAPPPDLPTATVRVQAAESGTHLATEEVAGTVRAKLRAVLEARFSGRIQEMRVVPGQRVKRGELLVQIDAPEIQARLDQALAHRDQAELDFKRFATLMEQNAVTRQEFDAVQAGQRIAEAAVTEAEAMLGYARLSAPFDGVITRKLADVGDLAAPGKPLLELEDPAALRLEFDLPEGLIGRLKQGQQLDVRVSDLAEAVQGVVVEIAPTADPASRTSVVKLDLPPAPGLRAGAFARVAVPVGESRVLRLPAEAVIQRGQLEYVFVAAGGRAQLRLVKTGRREGQEVQILAGITAGEPVVISGGAQLREGQPLEIQP